MVRWVRSHPVISSIVLVAVAAGAALVIASQQAGKLRESLQSAAIGLVFVALIGGVVKMLLDDYQRAREKRVEEARFVTAMLADLKSVYDRVERARIVISAHRSARTYGAEMRDLIGACVQLRNVDRALLGSEVKRQKEISAAVSAMEQYLTGLTNEFSSEYKEISDLQVVHEARVKKDLEEVSVSTKLPDNRPWAKIQQLDRLSDFLTSGDFAKQFVGSLDDASRWLREELRELLGAKASAPVAWSPDK
jgi:cell division septum initiation protein DivIVA